MMSGGFQSLARLATILAVLAASTVPAASDESAVDEEAAKTKRPATLDRPVGVKPYFLSPPPERLAPSEEQRALDYRSRLEGEIKRLERRLTPRHGRRGSDRQRTIRRERARIGRIIRR